MDKSKLGRLDKSKVLIPNSVGKDGEQERRRRKTCSRLQILIAMFDVTPDKFSIRLWLAG